MGNKEVKRFIVRFLAFSSPLLLIIISFLILDPFKILYGYSSYSNAYVTLNPDYISTEIYLKNRSQQHYNSFLFGSSKTLAYKTENWKLHLNAASPFVYQSSSESLYGIYHKIKFIAENKDSIKNAILILDKSVLEVTANSTSHLYLKHPAISGESWLSFYCTYFKAYFSKFLFLRCIDFATFNKYRPYMEGYIDQGQTEYDSTTNDMYPRGLINERTKNREGHFQKLKTNLPRRDSIQKYCSLKTIELTQKEMLLEIKSIFEKHHTNYKIILGPNFDQIKLHPQDVVVLESIFDKKNIYDFSGINKYTNDIHNYYEASHYTIELGKLILDSIYKNEQRTQ